MLSNDNFFALLPLAGDMWGLGPDSVNLVAMPLFHIGGGGWAVAGQYEGAASVIVRDLDPAALVRLIPERHVTHAFLVPAVLQFMLMTPGVDDADFSSLDTHRLRRLADQRGGAGPQRGHVRRQVLAGVRAHRDHRRDRQPGARGPRPRRAQPAPPALVRRRRPRRRAAHRRPRVGRRRADGRRRRDLGRGLAGDEGLLEQRRTRPPRRSTPTAGSAPATPATSTTTATSTSTTA